MNWLSLLFARRYLFSRKSHSVINTISRVSSFAIGISAAAMIILLSVFNGLSGIVEQMYNSFDPDIAIKAERGKTFEIENIDEEGLKAIAGVGQLSYILEDNALLQYRGRQTIGILRGVDSMYTEVIPIEDLVVRGQYELMFGDNQQLLVGQGIAYNLGVNPQLYDRMTIFVPQVKNPLGGLGALLPMNNYKSEKAYPAGVFALDAETDGQFVIGPLSLAQSLFSGKERASMVAVKCSKGADLNKVRDRVAAYMGDDFSVKTRYQQKETIYRIMQYEKWGVFLIVALVMIIASFSIIGSLSMLIIDKRRDIRTLFSIGGTLSFVRDIFVKEGMLIAMLGTGCGLALGVIFCFMQQWFGFIKIPTETLLFDSYPVVVELTDVLIVIATFLIVNYIIAKFTVVKMISKSDIRV